MEWLWLDINLHQVHHVSVRIPWYHLRKASQALQEKAPQLWQEKLWSWSLMRECWSVTNLKREREGVYRLAED
jgi:omega-6 fatty acid desaturase (delta-12 desaturase)